MPTKPSFTPQPFTPEHKLGSLLHRHRQELQRLTAEAQTIAVEATDAATAGCDATLHEAARKLGRNANSILSRLQQIRAAKDVASTLGIRLTLDTGRQP
jgi:hypothetical protein